MLKISIGKFLFFSSYRVICANIIFYLPLRGGNKGTTTTSILPDWSIVFSHCGVHLQSSASPAPFPSSLFQECGSDFSLLLNLLDFIIKTGFGLQIYCHNKSSGVNLSHFTAFSIWAIPHPKIWIRLCFVLCIFKLSDFHHPFGVFYSFLTYKWSCFDVFVFISQQFPKQSTER